MRKAESNTDWVLSLSLVEVILLLVFAVMIINVTDNVEGREDPQAVEGTKALQARFDEATEKNAQLEKQLRDVNVFIDDLKLMADAKTPSKEGFQEAIESLRRGYALCQKENNTLIEASVQNGVETIQVIAEIPSDLEANLGRGDETSDLDQIVSFIQDVYQYEKDHKCRFNYRLRYATDNDYKKAREGFEKYFYPEKIMKMG